MSIVDQPPPMPGVIYGIRYGTLRWFRDLRRNGENGPDGFTGWASMSGHQIHPDWQDIRLACSTGDGTIYAIRKDGFLLYYGDTLRTGQNKPDGSKGWAHRSGYPIGTDWQDIVHLWSNGPRSRDKTGNIYAIHRDGSLRWYKDTLEDGSNASDGSTGWAPGSGNKIGTGWQDMRHVCGDGWNIYAVHRDGSLLWYGDTKQDGSNAADGSTGWAPGSGNKIGTGWQDIVHLTAGGGSIYGVHRDGRVFRYGDTKQDGSNAADGSTGWAPGSGNQIAKGWT